LPVFALARASNAKEVGLYGAALALITVLSLMNDALRTIILPDVSALRTSLERRTFRKRVLRVAPVFFGIATLTLASMALMQYYVLGGVYSASIPVFLILGGSLVFAIYIGIFNTLVHSHGVPRLEATNNLGRIVVLAFLLFLLPKTAMFMSLAFALVLVAGEIRIYIVLRNKESDVSDVSAD
jgi:O-antigen/teichoic acid export membrane protein